MIQSGRYSNCSFQYVMAKDKDYCGWVVQALHEKRALPQDLRQFAELIKKQEGGIQRVGAYRNWFFRDIWRKDQGYCRWAASLDQPGPGMEPFSRYAARKLGCPRPERPSSVRKADAPPTHRNEELPKKPEHDLKRARAEEHHLPRGTSPAGVCALWALGSVPSLRSRVEQRTLSSSLSDLPKKHPQYVAHLRSVTATRCRDASVEKTLHASWPVGLSAITSGAAFA